MKAGEKVKFYYVDKYGIKQEKTRILTNDILKEEYMSNEEVKTRLTLELRNYRTEILVEKGYIFAARNLLKICGDAKEIDIIDNNIFLKTNKFLPVSCTLVCILLFLRFLQG